MDSSRTVPTDNLKLAATGIEGTLLIDLRWQRGCVTEVSLSSTRPLQMPRIFHGRSADEVMATLPVVYSLCGMAQACAAAEALEQAAGIEVSAQTRHSRRLLVAFETIKEHLWRIERDWAGFLGQRPDLSGISDLLALMRTFRATLFPAGGESILGGRPVEFDPVQLGTQLDQLESLLRRRVFAQSPQSWLELSDRDGLSCWSRGSATLAQAMLAQIDLLGEAEIGRTTMAALGQLDNDALNRLLSGADADQFVAQPDWQQKPRETTPYTRQRYHPLLISLEEELGNGLLTRMTARLVEVAALVIFLRGGTGNTEELKTDVNSRGLAAGIGISQVEAARGRLVHRVVLERALVRSYRILAPTEWNFHPRGVLVQGLTGLQARTQAELNRRAASLINAIDPCVGYQLRIIPAEEEPQ